MALILFGLIGRSLSFLDGASLGSLVRSLLFARRVGAFRHLRANGVLGLRGGRQRGAALVSRVSVT
jgi:hypothetical protein